MCRVDGRKSCHNPLSYPYPADRSTSQVSVARMVRDHCGCPGTPGLGSRGVVNTEMAVLWYRCVLRLPYLTSPSRFQSRQPEKKKNDKPTGPLEQGRPPLKLDGARGVRGSVERDVDFVVALVHSAGLPIARFDEKGDGQGRRGGVGNVDLVSQKVGVGKRRRAEVNRNFEGCREADGRGSEDWRLGRWCIFGKLGEVFEVERMVQSV